ncbi:MAG: O-methyltransferase-domain-containing protein [Benjaminiella poitrasii]|nr:MAG: O-methyltransferase-domain-containing protein [Benjaminiella poitrasii]
MNWLRLTKELPAMIRVKPYRPILKWRQFTTLNTTHIASNGKGQLRASEEEFCNDLSTPFKEPYQGVLNSLLNETKINFRNPRMMISQTQAKFLHQFIALLRPNRILEIGGFTGYSAIAMGSALQPQSKLVSLELDPSHIATAKRFIGMANLQDRIEIKEGPADKSLVAIGENPLKTQYDLIFLDADKGGYINYFEIIMKYDLLSNNGVIVADNVLYQSQVHKEAGYEKDELDIKASKKTKKTALKMLEFNKHIASDPRVEMVILPVFDGLSFIRKKSFI